MKGELEIGYYESDRFILVNFQRPIPLMFVYYKLIYYKKQD